MFVASHIKEDKSQSRVIQRSDRAGLHKTLNISVLKLVNQSKSSRLEQVQKNTPRQKHRSPCECPAFHLCCVHCMPRNETCRHAQHPHDRPPNLMPCQDLTSVSNTLK